MWITNFSVTKINQKKSKANSIERKLENEIFETRMRFSKWNFQEFSSSVSLFSRNRNLDWRKKKRSKRILNGLYSRVSIKISIIYCFNQLFGHFNDLLSSGYNRFSHIFFFCIDVYRVRFWNYREMISFSRLSRSFHWNQMKYLLLHLMENYLHPATQSTAVLMVCCLSWLATRSKCLFAQAVYVSMLTATTTVAAKKPKGK